LRQHAEKNNLSISQVIMANEVAVSGKSEAEINAFLDKVAGAMLATVKAGLSVKDDILPGPIKLHSKAATVWERAQDDKYESDRAIALVSACALAASEENARGHLVITAPTGGSAGVMPAIVYALVNSKRKLPMDKVREGLLAPARPSAICASTMRRSLVRRAAVSPRSASLRPCPPRSSPRSRALRSG
jgi:L-serine dehydratase